MENMLAAQYLRVSTERQEYSLECQRAGIETYARQHNFTVCRTYIDAARSGLEIKHRQELCQLLHGYRAGSYAGYGLRRTLLSADKTPKGLLLLGERKNVTNERVTLGPGRKMKSIGCEKSIACLSMNTCAYNTSPTS